MWSRRSWASSISPEQRCTRALRFGPWLRNTCRTSPHSSERSAAAERMKLGFFTMPIHPVGRDLLETLKEDRELAIVADRLGFVEGFFGEHITDAAETI